MYGFIDESGAPGKANTKNDYISMTLVIFKNARDMGLAIRELSMLRKKLNLPKDFEFHLSRNTPSIQDAFLECIQQFNFSYIFVYSKKTEENNAGSYYALAKKLVSEIKRHNIKLSKVRMDDNANLHKSIKECSKVEKLFFSCKEGHSKSYDLLQVADYIVSMSTKELKGKRISPNWHDITKKKLV